MSARLETHLDIAVDVVGAAVHAVEEPHRAEDARAVRHADADVGFLELVRAEEIAHVDVDRRIEVPEELRGIAAAQLLVAPLAEGNAARVRDAAAEAEARAQPVAPPGAEVVIGLDVAVDLPRVRLQAVLLVPHEADEGHDVDRPAREPLHQALADVEAD